ncbi:dynein regulatory complex subunit 2 [Hyposmocoma kahamanoa]|uniref:dynein regulatory complex subunit 2 n=1 Tax=Hyposmocoma kahamanoa TaxID=1477025 RepID=UPI000E6D7CDD|nr:dynein regulatory complex subunit 2 [Hyposmocoma kahamanoa]
MPKKPKVNKLARMSDEERARYLQHRADVEEEARRRKRELIARFIKNKLDKEEAFSRINTSKINQGWRYILRRIKCKQMEQDIMGMIDNFNFMVERKDRQISSLTKAIEDADEQHRRAFQAHTETLSYFLNVGYQRLDKLQSNYDQQKNSLLETGEKEEQDISDSQEKAEFKLKLIIYIQNRNFEKYKKESEYQYATEINDGRLEHEEQMRALCKPKRLEIENIWAQLREVYNSYSEQHNPIMGHYNSLREKDDFYRKDIARNELQIQQATDVLLNLQKEWMNTTSSIAYKLQRMNNHKEQLTKRYSQMKKDDKTAKNRAAEKLELMVNVSQDTIQHLEAYKNKINKIMQLAEICRKYETKEDIAVLREAVSSNTSELEFENLDEAMAEEYKEYRKLDKFLLKSNHVTVQTMCLKAEKAKLAKENVQLKHYIKQYLTEMALRGGKDRPLSVKLQSGMQKIDTAGKVLNRPVTCIEGVLSNAVMHEKRMKTLALKNKELEIRSYPRVHCRM